MIFQTAVRKYVGIHEKSKSGLFLVFSNKFQFLKQKKFGRKMRNFYDALIFFQIFTISKMKTRTQIFPKMDKNNFIKLKYI